MFNKYHGFNGNFSPIKMVWPSFYAVLATVILSSPEVVFFLKLNQVGFVLFLLQGAPSSSDSGERSDGIGFVTFTGE